MSLTLILICVRIRTQDLEELFFSEATPMVRIFSFVTVTLLDMCVCMCTYTFGLDKKE